MSEPDVPVFGVDALPRRPFKLRVWGPKPDEHEDVPFTAYDLDAASLILLSRAGSDQAQANAVVYMLEKCLVDDDGLSVDYAGPTDEEVELRAAALAREAGRDKPTDADYDAADEELTDDRLDDEAQWSSRRRFFAVMDSQDRRVHLDAFVELAEHLADVATDFPTNTPSGSSSGRRRNGRGSKGRRR